MDFKTVLNNNRKKKNREQNAKSEGGKFQTEETIYKMWKIPETTQTSNSVWSFESSLNICFCNVRISESCAGGKKLVRLLTHSQKSVAKNNSIMAKKYTLVKTKANKLNETEPKSERINFNCINRFFAMCVCHKYVCTFKFPKSEKRKKAIWCCNSTIPCDNSNEYPTVNGDHLLFHNEISNVFVFFFFISVERAMSPAQSEDSGLAADRGTTYATISLPRENVQAMGIVFLGKWMLIAYFKL